VHGPESRSTIAEMRRAGCTGAAQARERSFRWMCRVRWDVGSLRDRCERTPSVRAGVGDHGTRRGVEMIDLPHRQLGSAALNWCTARVMMLQNDPENDHGLG
jgi:hypothetical protein